MAERKISFADNCMILEAEQDTVNLQTNQIEEIEVTRIKKKRLFFTRETDCIKVRTTQRRNPYILSRDQDEEKFKLYVKDIQEFAEKHHIPFENNLGEDA